MSRLRRNPELRPSPWRKNMKGRDLRWQDLSHMDLSGVDLSSARLEAATLEGSKLTGANLFTAKLADADLSGADLTGAKLGGATLTGANLSRANLDGADLGGAVLTGANLAGAKLTRVKLFGAMLNNADLTDADVTGTNLGFVSLGGAKGLDKAKGLAQSNPRRARRNPELRPSPYGKQLAGRDLSRQDLSHMDLSGAELGGANLSGAKLEGADLKHAKLEGANLTNAYLTNANLEGANLNTNLYRANLFNANLTNAYLVGANLAGANLFGANLEGADLKHANLTGTSFTGAYLVGANLAGANLDGANFNGANLTGANLTNANLKGANLLYADLTDVKGLDTVKGLVRHNPRTIPASKGTLMRAPRSARRNPDATFTVFHADHGVSPAQMDFIKGQLAQSAPQGFFIREIMIPQALGTVRNALYGPAAGDAPVPESSVSYRPRGDRPWADRVVSWPTRPADRVQAIGVREGDAFKLFTVYGGYLAPQHPDDPANPDVAAARRFWSQHALSLEQWDGPKVAKSNSPYPRHVAVVHEAAQKHGLYLQDLKGQVWKGGPLFSVYGLPRAKDFVGSVQVTSNGLLLNGKLHPWSNREEGPIADFSDFFGRLAAEHGHARSNPELRPSPYGKNLAGKDLSRQNLSCMDLSGADLAGANLTRADLTGANLSGANLTNAKLEGANLTSANLTKASLDDANLRHAYLTRANFTFAHLYDANLEGAYLSDVRLHSASLIRANFTNADLHSANLANADLFDAKLTGADLEGADLADASLVGAKLKGAKLTGAKLEDANLAGADLPNANLEGKNLTGVNLYAANLDGANLKGANLTGAILVEANLEGADLTGANLSGANLTNAYFSGANLTGANLTDVKGLDTVKGLVRRNPNSRLVSKDTTMRSPRRAHSNPNTLTTKKYHVDRHELRLRGTFRPAPWGGLMPPRNLRGQDLSHMDLRGAMLMDADLSHANLSGSDLRGANLFQADLSHANLTQAHLEGAELGKANLSRANLTGAKLPHAHLNGANLVAAKLDLADLSHADLTHALVGHASIFKAKLTGLKGLDTATGIGTLAGLTLVDGLVPKFNPRARHNPFFVSPKGTAVKVSDADFEARNLPRSIEREVEIEGFDPGNLPPGFSVQAQGGRFHVFFEGRDTGLFATDPRKAAEIASRKQGSFSAGAAPKATAARPSAEQASNPLFGFGREELVKRSRAGDQAAAAELVRRGRDPLTGADNRGGLRSRLSKAVANPRRR